MRYDETLIEEVMGEIRGLPQIIETDLSMLFPPHSSIDLIADEPVSYFGPNGASTECRFKGIINMPRFFPLIIQLYSDASSGKTAHILAIAHSLDMRASQDSVICRSYVLDVAQAIRFAELHRRFYELQDPGHVLKINTALEKRELRQQYVWQRFAKK